MNSYYLKATSQHAFEALTMPEGAIVDVIGTVFVPTGKLDADEQPIMRKRRGWHVNLYTVEPLTDEQLDGLPTIEAPETPMRILAE